MSICLYKSSDRYFCCIFLAWFLDQFFCYIRTLTFAVVHCLFVFLFCFALFFVLEFTLPNFPSVRNQWNFPLHTATHEIITWFFLPFCTSISFDFTIFKSRSMDRNTSASKPVILNFEKIYTNGNKIVVCLFVVINKSINK